MTDKRIPSFWVSEEYSGCTLEEFVTKAVRSRDSQMFSLKDHRGLGWKGAGKCVMPNCEVCLILKKLGV